MSFVLRSIAIRHIKHKRNIIMDYSNFSLFFLIYNVKLLLLLLFIIVVNAILGS